MSGGGWVGGGGGGLQWDGRVQHVEERKKAEDGGMHGGESRPGGGPDSSQTLLIPLF